LSVAVTNGVALSGTATQGNDFTIGFGIHTRPAGTSKQAKYQVSANDIVWADLIAVMEYKHKYALQEKFSRQLKHKTILVLDIPDDYHYINNSLKLLSFQ
jgi:predicted protein tyrosine phosphatase